MRKLNSNQQSGFTLVEVVIAIVIFPIIVIGISQAYDSVRKSYTVARQLNEVYAVLSACPEIDRALEFNSLTTATNCFPNNTFKNEGYSNLTTAYSPILTVTDTTALGVADPLRTVPDSKVINISVDIPASTAPDLEFRLLVTRNGIGQQ